MKTHTHREYLLWTSWLDAEWEKPSRSDNYLMQIAMEVARVLSKKPKLFRLEQFKLTWQKEKPKQSKLTKKEAAKISKARWFGMTGITEDN